MERIDDVFIYPVDLKGKAKAVVTPCIEGYTVYTDINLSQEQRIKAYLHEINHIKQGDFEREDVQVIESERHEG